MGSQVINGTFGFEPGRTLAGKYEIVSVLGSGWEGEVYRVRETGTGIERTAKFFFPKRNVRDRAIKAYARKMHDLRQCPIIIQYHTQETIHYRGAPLRFLVSEYVHGPLLSEFLAGQRGKRLSPFQAVHLLHALATGMEQIHNVGQYHGDLHTDNLIVVRYGLTFQLKVLDVSYPTAARTQNIRHDVVDMIHVFHDVLGGAKRYASQPRPVKEICCGLKRSLIWRKFRSAGQLRQFLEEIEWD